MDSPLLASLREIKLKRHKDPSRPTRTKKDLDLLLNMNANRNTTQASKDLNAILIKFAFYTACRVSEICDLKLENVFLDEGRIQIVHGKGGKTRWVGINKELKEDFRKYIYEQR